jgi:splicing factor 3A subunit 3
MSTLLERTRQLHADIERCERGVVKCLRERDEISRHKELLWNEHRISHLCQEVGEHSSALRAVYDDTDGSRRGEMSVFSGGGKSEKQFGAFYDRLRDIKDYYRRFPSAELLDPQSEEGGEAEIYTKPAEPVWSGEEAWGRFLDLHAHHEAWMNLPGNNIVAEKKQSEGEGDDDDAEPTTYAEYVDMFSGLAEIPVTKKRAWGRRYAAYLEALRDYLVGFAKRAQPLVPFSGCWPEDGEKDFEEKWVQGSVAGWGAKAGGAQQEEGIDLGPCHTAQALGAAVGMEDLKEELERLGLKCGGNLEQRAARLFLTKGTALSDLPPSVFAGARGKGKGKRRRVDHPPSTAAGGGALDAEAISRSNKEMARLEVQIAQLCELLHSVVEATKIQIEKKQTRTMEELEAELEEDAPHAGDSDSDDEEKAIYNPKNLPLGWDGKPIPYWLYKLHGLNIEYNCEICGNYKYYGPRSFDRHFSEWRHTHGLKCLGIAPDLFKYFHGVTEIEDALSLVKTLKSQTKLEFQSERDEECEDDEGNVYAKKTFEDLAKQGIISAAPRMS